MSRIARKPAEYQLELFSAEIDAPIISDLAPLPDDDRDAPERWLPVPGWPGYEISNHGTLRTYCGSGRSLAINPRPIPKIIGGYPQKRKGVVVSLTVCLYRTNADGSREDWRPGLHVLVLTVFKGPCPPGMQCCHGDSNPKNNHLWNLRWDTPANNKLDLMWREDSQFKLCNEDILEIWPRLLAGEKDSDIARDYGVTNAAINGIKAGNQWKHVTSTLPGYPIITEKRAAANREPIRIPAEFADSPIEIWRPIPGYPNYRVSTFGNIETCLKRIGFNKFALSDDWVPMTPYPSKQYGHMAFVARNGPKHRKNLGVHVAVLLAFAGPKPPGMIGSHEDDNPRNNRASNLKWDSHKGNTRDALRNAPIKAAQARDREAHAKSRPDDTGGPG